MQENEAYVIPTIELVGEVIEPLTKEPVHIVDLPGHEKLRFKFMEFAPITRGIIFLVDKHQDSSSEDVEYLGYENEDFKFEHLENRVEFISCSVANNEVNNLKEWISDVYSGY
ncbi:2086_t:CDS:2 [Ambispora leptoticha]|uniref:2086_t:CDS:1 n=1 Tax=Ambispora leptoticha TaxID=144679 RepID=A0A9N8Z0Q7_9GLOM|nr:2086_t:CDS:2 [Ambispora leptoticha]